MFILISQYIALKCGKEWRDYRRLGDLQRDLGKSLEEMLELVDDVLHRDPYSKEEICQLLSVSQDELASTSLSENTCNGN